MTTNSRVYPEKDPNSAIAKPNKDFIASIKSSHFDIATNNGRRSSAQVANHFTSLTIKDYNHKGNAAEIRSTLDEAKKTDLRTNHFEIGGRTSNYKNTTAGLSFRPSTAK